MERNWEKPGEETREAGESWRKWIGSGLEGSLAPRKGGMATIATVTRRDDCMRMSVVGVWWEHVCGV
jgi:hypothetical protein